ncbi:MAG: sialidase family protein [Acidobacteriota bacterium]
MIRFKTLSTILSILAVSLFLSLGAERGDNIYAQCVWGPDILLSEVDGEFSNQPDIASDGNYVHVVWQDYKDIGGQIHTSRIWYRNSDDSGVTWSNMKVITPKNSTGDFHEPRIAVSGKNIHVVFIGLDIVGGDMVSAVYYIQSTNNGRSWSKPLMLNMLGPFYYEAWYPDISVSGNTVHAVWVDDREGDDAFHVYYKRSMDNGKTWDDGDDNPSNDNADHSKKISAGTTDFLYPAITSYGENVHAVWQWEWSKVYYSGSLNNGATWSEPVIISEPGSRYPDVIAYENIVHIVWEDDRHLIEEECNSEIYYQRSMDDGLTWEPARRLTEMSMWSLDPRIDLYGNQIGIIWKDERDSPLDCGIIGPVPMGEIYYKRSIDGGVTWDDGDDDPGNDNADHTKRLSEIDESGGDGKAISVETQFTHVVFDDVRYDRPDPSDIFVKDVFYKQRSCP